MNSSENSPEEKEFEEAKKYFFLGLARFEDQQYQEAEKFFRASLKAVPDRLSTLTNLTAALIKQKKLDEADELTSRIIRLFPEDEVALLNKGNLLKIKGRFLESIPWYDKALVINTNCAEAYNSRGTSLKELGRTNEALDSFNKAFTINPECDYLLGNRLHTKMMLCEWQDFDLDIQRLSSGIKTHKKVSPSFPVLALIDSLPEHRIAAETWINDQSPVNDSLGPIPKLPRKQRIRLGYYSADFYNHATAYLMAELFESHDKTKFELIGFSFGPQRNDEMHRRISSAFDEFIDVRSYGDDSVALLSRRMGVDIAIDLKGLTQGAREGIFAYRAAPIQVSYIGYPGTMGAGYIDYLIADPVLIPEEHQKHYTEKIIYLPDSYQVNDRHRTVSDKNFSTDELELPSGAFVFCCFNNNYKITPRSFGGWMKILNSVDGSVLWLLEDNTTAAENLRKAARANGIDPQRLVFAKRTTLPEHLARHRAADLFLDSLPYNAHTTASDALWTGLPVLTCIGNSFASRVAASLLHAVELPEMITRTQEEYEMKAIELAKNPDMLGLIKEKLHRNRLTTALFDTPRYTRHLESAYRQIYERYHDDCPAEHIRVDPIQRV